MESACESDIFGMFLSLLLAVVPVNKYRNVFLRFIRPFCSQVVCLSLPGLDLTALYCPLAFMPTGKLNLWALQ
jgi:hypothetical protein